jgi:hypothetical protein
VGSIPISSTICLRDDGRDLFCGEHQKRAFSRGFVGVAKDARTWHPDLGQLGQVAAVMGPFCHMEIQGALDWDNDHQWCFWLGKRPGDWRLC